MPDGSIKKLDITGTLDLLGYDQDGKFYVFDMKTVRSDNYINDKEKNDKWNRQLQLYKQFLQDKYNIEVAGTYIIPIKVNYDTPLGAKHKDGTDMGGTAEYSVKNPELKIQYDNPNRSQILQDGIEFRDAAPELRPILNKNPHEGNIKYEYLDDAAKAILDGTVTAENYKQQQTTEKIEKPIDVTEEVKEDISIEDEFAQFEDDGSFDDFDSSVTEMTSKQENDYTPEIQSIKEKAIANGTFMKAPNGKPTNLNERQWLQVRTKAFKEWFGDWEAYFNITNRNRTYKYFDDLYSYIKNKTNIKNDFIIDYINFIKYCNGIYNGNYYRNKIGFINRIHQQTYIPITEATSIVDDLENEVKNYDKYLETETSKVIDENGEPLVVYHYTSNNSNITAFDLNRTGQNWKQSRRYNRPAAFFLSQKQGNYNEWGEKEMAVFLNIKYPSISYITSDIKPIKIDYNDFESDGYTPIFVYSYEESNTYLEKEHYTDKEKRLYKTHLKNIGKGERFSYGEFVIFDPNQVKSATDNSGTFSTINDDIRYSSVTELPSIPAFAERLPVAQQARFGFLVTSAEISTSCR